MKGRLVEVSGNTFFEISGANLQFKGDKFDPEQTYLFAYEPPDDYLNFPGKACLEFAGQVSGIGTLAVSASFVGAGIAHHRLEQDAPSPSSGLTARDLEVLQEIDWRIECTNVLQAHDWLDESRQISRRFAERLIGDHGLRYLLDAQQSYRDGWLSHVFEQASAQYLEPLTRLWYVCNMLALKDLHQDDLRLGFLWCEYQQRLRNERALSTGKKMVKAAPLGGKTRAQMHEPRNSKIIGEMQRLLVEGHSKRRAAELAFQKGLGTSPEANRKIWSRQA